MTLTTDQKLTVTQWAASLGISKQAGYLAVKRCGIDVVDGRVDPDIATVLYRRGTQPRARRARPEDPGAAIEAAQSPQAPVAGKISYDEARRRREVAEAQISELREAELRGELVRKAVIERETASRLVALRESLEVLADRISALVAAESDPTACRRIIRDEHRNALAAFAASEHPETEDEGHDGRA